MSSSSNSQQDPNAYGIVAVSPNKLLEGRRYYCDTCSRGFAREQNLKFHGRSHNLPCDLKNKLRDDSKKVYLCLEPTCINHDPSHTLRDYAGLKKHYLRKHVTQKIYKCTTCSKAYAVEADLKAHLKTCAIEKHKCSCGHKFQKKRDLTLHRERCKAKKHKGAIRHSPAVDMGNSSVNLTGNITETLIDSYLSYPFITGDASVGNSQLSYIQTPMSNPYCTVEFLESQLPTFATHGANLMTNHSMGLNPDQNFNPSYFPSIQQKQHELQQTYEVGFFTELLMNDNVSIDNFKLDNSSFIGGNDGMTQAVHDTGLNGMMNNGYGGGVVSFNQDYGSFNQDYGSLNQDYGQGYYH